MQSSMARDNYLVTEVRTATPQKLQLLLIDAALRSAKRARQFWEQNQDDLAVDSLVHAQSVLGQMLAGMDRQAGGELAARASTLYEFIFRSLVNAGYRHDEKSHDDAVRILEIERETWRQLCETLAVNSPVAVAEEDARSACPPLRIDPGMESMSGGFSLDA